MMDGGQDTKYRSYFNKKKEEYDYMSIDSKLCDKKLASVMTYLLERKINDSKIIPLLF